MQIGRLRCAGEAASQNNAAKDCGMTVLDWYNALIELLNAFIAWIESILGFSL